MLDLSRNSSIREADGFGLSTRARNALRRIAITINVNPSMTDLAALDAHAVAKEVNEPRVFGELRDMLHAAGGLDFVNGPDFDPTMVAQGQTVERGAWTIKSIHRCEGDDDGFFCLTAYRERGNKSYWIPILIPASERSAYVVGQQVRLAVQAVDVLRSVPTQQFPLVPNAAPTVRQVQFVAECAGVAYKTSEKYFSGGKVQNGTRKRIEEALARLVNS